MLARRIAIDSALLVVSVLVAVAIAQSGVVQLLSTLSADGGVAASFFAGMFFTSVFTAAPATVVLGELAVQTNVFVVAVVGALGSVVGDYVIYTFLRTRLLRDASDILNKSRLHRLYVLLKRRRYERLMQFIGIILLVTPLPDEPALAMLGLSSISTRAFIALSFSTHLAGILVIGLVSQSLA